MSAARLGWAGGLGRLTGFIFSIAGLAVAGLSFNYARTADAAAATALSVLYFEQPSVDDLARVAEKDRSILSSSACNARVRSPDALIRLNIIERDSLDGAAPTRELLESLRDVLERAAACTPTQAMNWLGLAWLENLSPRPSSLRNDYFRLAFAAAPREAWIMTRRLMVLAAEVDLLPPDLQAKTLEDFRAIVAAGFLSDAYQVLVDRGWVNRDLLLRAITDVERSRREPFAAAITRRTGLAIEWPGDTPREPRPWR